MSKQIVIIGGGAAGLMAGIQAARQGASVTILERNEVPGKKLLSTGNGRCNLTNLALDVSAYRGEDPAFAAQVLRQFSVMQTLEFFHHAGLMTTDREGWVYPRSMQAASVLRVLTEEAVRLKIKLKTRASVKSLLPENGGWRILTNGWEYRADAVIVTGGSRASGQEGTEELLLSLSSLGHRVIHPFPALVPLRCEGKHRWSGVRIHGRVILHTDSAPARTEEGEIQLTDYGVSGIPVFQLSRFAVEALQRGDSPELELDFLPELPEEAFASWIREQKGRYPEKNLQTILNGCLPEKLAALIAGQKDPVHGAKCFRVKIAGSLPFSAAQVCGGGIACSGLHPETLESRLCPGLYFAGEIIDVDGPCGGYNLQWAWSSGAIAGLAASADKGEAL